MILLLIYNWAEKTFPRPNHDELDEVRPVDVLLGVALVALVQHESFLQRTALNNIHFISLTFR